jgi:Mg-chelatase subunit ChlD
MITGELTWQQFRTLDSIRNLNENQQMEHYYKYLVELNDWIRHQNKGDLVSQVITCADGMDIVFLVDYTGSMGAAINAIKTAIASIVSTIVAESANNYRLGLVLFDEYTSGTTSNYSSKTAYTSLPSSQKYVNTGLGGKYQWITALEVFSENNQSSFTTQLNLLNNATDFPLGNGQNTPEPSDMGVDRIVNYDLVGTFRNDVSKLIILVTDATPSGNDDATNATDTAFIDTLVTDCNEQGIKVLLMKQSAASVAPLETLALETGGLVSESFTPTSIITSIENICT